MKGKARAITDSIGDCVNATNGTSGPDYRLRIYVRDYISMKQKATFSALKAIAKEFNGS